MGAGKLYRIKEGWKAGIKMVWAVSIPIVILYLTAGESSRSRTHETVYDCYVYRFAIENCFGNWSF